MDSSEKMWFPEMDAEKSQMDTEKSHMDTEKKARRSSILKPQKQRNPFSTLDFTEPNPDNTLAKAARRVSFATSNFVKPFAADPEKNTIWDNTYEEEVNHTDSTKSSYEQTKSIDFLNSTSHYSPASKEIWCDDIDMASSQIVYPEIVLGTNNLNPINPTTIINDNRTANIGDSLISFVRNSNIKMTVETCSVNKPIGFTLENRTIYAKDSMEVTKSAEVKNDMSEQFKNDISLITPINDSLTDYIPCLQNSIKIATCINKENVNPIINDVSLVASVENKLRRSSRLKSNSSVKNVSACLSKENDNQTCPEKSQNCPSQTIMFSQCDMELTGSLSVMDIKENFESNTKPVVNKTVCFLEQDMELTKSLDVKGKTHLNSIEPKYSKRDTISFNRSDGDMEFACDLPTLIRNQRQGDDIKNENSIQLEQHDVDMEITAALPFPRDLTPVKSQNRMNSKRKTIYFDESDDNMEFTNTLPVTNIQDTPAMFSKIILSQDDVKCIFANKESINNANSTYSNQRPINFNETGCNMELTGISHCEPHTIKNSNLQLKSNHDDIDDQCIAMEYNDLPTEDMKVNIEESISNSKRRTIHFNESEDNMELTSTLPVVVKNSNLQMVSNHDGQCIAIEYNDLPTKDVKVNIEESNSNSKRKTIHFNEFEDDMELTSALPVVENITNLNRNTHNQAKKIELIILPSDSVIKERTPNVIAPIGETIHFNQSAANMEFTAALPIANIIEKEKTSEIKFISFEGDTKFKDTFPAKDINIHSEIKHIQSIKGEDMEFPATFLNKNTVQQNSIDVRKATIIFSQDEDDTEYTNTLATKNKLIYEKGRNITGHIVNCKQTEGDMEFTANLPVKNEILENKRINQIGIKKELDINLPTKMNTIRNESELNVSDNQVINSENSFDTLPKVEESNECMRNSRTSIINKPNTDIKRRSNSENCNEVIKKIKIGLSLSQEILEYPYTSVNKNACDTEKSSHENLVKGAVCKKTEILVGDNPLPVATNETDSNQLHSDIDKGQKACLQTSTISNSNILYSEPMKINLKTHNFTTISDLSANLNLKTLEGSLNLNPVSTPAVSFHMNLSNMSPCIEDTQQLIHATFSKPESLKVLLGKQNIPEEHVEDILCDNKENIISNIKTKNSLHAISDKSCKAIEELFKTDQCRGIEKTYVVENTLQLGNIENNSTELQATNLMWKSISEKRNSYDFMDVNSDNPNTERSCYIEDISLLPLAPNDIDELSLVNNTSNPMNSEDEKLVPEYKTTEHEPFNNTSDCSDDSNNYTLRSHSVLANINKYLISYKVERKSGDSKINLQMKQLKDNKKLIKDLINNFRVPKISIIGLEEQHKQDMEENSSSESEATLNTEDDKKAPSIAGLLPPKSLHDRICEIAERCKKHWKFVRMEDDYYYFLTLFGTLPFKVQLHPELGMVYSIETYANLEDVAKPICWYELKSFQQKLKREHLISVLGAKYDIFSLLDYICMAMEETVKYHVEYNNLVKKYGMTHHFKMNSDFSVTFEIINVDLIICWIICVKMSPTSSISKDNVTAISKVGEKVNEEDIKCIAENTPKGSNFSRNFIENVDEYVRRIGKKIKFRRGNKF